MPWRRRIRRAGSSGVAIRIPQRERAVVAEAIGRLRSQLDGDLDDPDLRRLFPPAYESLADEAEYQRLMHDQLLEDRRSALQTVAETLERDRLDEEEADAWLTALNDVRLVLGTRLDVTQATFEGGLDRRDPRARELAVYAYLSWLQEQLVEAVTDRYPAS